MAKRKYKKRVSNQTSKRRSSQRQKNKTNLTVAGLIILSILLAVLLYGNSGVVGIKLNEILGGMIGLIKYVLPIGLFIFAIKIATDENEYSESKLLQCSLFFLSLAVLMSVVQINDGELNIVDKSMSNILKDAYSTGMQNSGGGVLGALIAVCFVKLLGNVGAIVLSAGIAILLLIYVLGIDVSNIVNKIIENAKERREEKRELKAEREEEEFNNKLKDDKQSKNEQEVGEQIKINFGDKVLNDDSQKGYLENNIFKRNQNKSDNQEKTQNTESHDNVEKSLFKTEEQQKEDKTKEVLQLEHAMMVEDENYEYPPIELLSKPEKKALKGSAKALTDTATKLQKTLYSFGVSAKVENVSVGPAITRYELKPAEGVRVSKIANLADDIALNLAAETIRIEAPIPGKQAVGIEIPNKEKQAVHLREVLESTEFENNKSKLTVALGKDVAGNIQLADIAKMPHVLIAGATGSGKSVCINTIVTSIIYNAKPSEVKMVMIDPKVVELSVYNGIPHLLIPVVTDPKKAAGALAWAVQEMDDRYNKFASKGVRDLNGYNKAIEKEDGIGKMPQIVIIVDELADLMMVAAKDVEDSICRLAQKARAAGMHLVIATQRPSVDVITGLIKANIPSRIAFAVSSQVDSRTILDSVGAEKLLGKGDMLFFPTGYPKPVRVQGAFVSDDEVEKIVDFVKQNGTATYSEDILESIENSNKTEKELEEEQAKDDEVDPLLMDAIDMVVEQGRASTSFIQRRFNVGYARAGRIIDQMEARGIISGYQGSKPREVLITKEKLDELKMSTSEKNETDTEDK